MRKEPHILLLLFIALFSFRSEAQYPHFFSYNDENGLPSNTVYSIEQDKKGFIWIGSDAGLFKFDGIRYIPFKSSVQKSKSITGLTVSSNGRIYCINFQSQIFYVENDSRISSVQSLKELKHGFSNIPNIATDKTGNLIVNHSEGISVYDEKTKQWKTFRDFGKGHFPVTEHFTKSVRINKKNEACFLNTSGAGVISGGKLQLLKNDCFNKTPHGSFILECVEDELWIFSAIGNQIYKTKNGKTSEVNRLNLKTALENKKITNVNYLPDGKLWIATYSGMFRYDPKTDVVQLFYPEYSFSDCLIDRENNYWLTTLQNGILRLPNLHFLVWNSNDKKLSNDRLTKITADESHIYFATLNGTINSLKRQTGDVRQLYAGNGADIQCFEYISDDKSLYFSTNNSLFALKNDKLIIQHESLAPPKSILKVNNQYLMASSFGTYVYSKGKEYESYRITNSWSRKVMYDSVLNICRIAANDGLIQAEMFNGEWKSTDTLIRNKQVLSVDLDTDRQLLYALTFDGGIYEVNAHKSQQLIGKLPEKVQAYTLKFYRNKIYLATNNGVWILDKSTQKWETINKFTGAVSDNIQGFSIVANTLWIATGKGLQKIPLPYKKDYVQPLVYLKKIKIDERTVSSTTNLTLDYHQTLILVPEVSSLSSRTFLPENLK